jgi:hypothetical protein
MTLKGQDGKYFENGGAGGMVEASEDGRLSSEGDEDEGDTAEGVEEVGVGGVAGDGDVAGDEGPSLVAEACASSACSSAAIGDNGGIDGAGIAVGGESSKDSQGAGGVKERWRGGDDADGGVDDGGVAVGAGVAGLERGERRSSLSSSSSIPRRSSASLRRLRTRLAGGGIPSDGDGDGAVTQAEASTSGAVVAAEAERNGVTFTRAGTAAREDGGCSRD